MMQGFVVRKNQYFDSVFLMRVASRISQQSGVLQAAALMATAKNKELLKEMGFGEAELSAASPNDLILGVIADSDSALRAVLQKIDEWLSSEQAARPRSLWRTLDQALASQTQANLALISVPGEYAAREAQNALASGLNVFLFSDGVPVESELAIKRYARDRGLIVMGPDCGTAIIGGVGLGFANVVRRGPIGAIAASGTGLQEFTSLVHRAGSGISHAIGIGGRDLSDEIGGVSALTALEALARDRETEVIAFLSKPPGPRTISRIVDGLREAHKPTVACFLGITPDSLPADLPFPTVHTIDAAAEVGLQLVGKTLPSTFARAPQDLEALVQQEVSRMNPGQHFIRGIFAGGTFCFQAQQIIRDVGIAVHSNAPLAENLRLQDPRRSLEHTLVDMGTGIFTQGRPHPMIDSTLRRERVLEEAKDPEVAVLLLDFILGHGAAPDPVGELVEAVREAKRMVAKSGAYLSVVASVCGTEGDPQGLGEQTRLLKETDVVVFPSAAQAAGLAARIALAQR